MTRAHLYGAVDLHSPAGEGRFCAGGYMMKLGLYSVRELFIRRSGYILRRSFLLPFPFSHFRGLVYSGSELYVPVLSFGPPPTS